MEVRSPDPVGRRDELLQVLWETWDRFVLAQRQEEEAEAGRRIGCCVETELIE